jgi:hypothetical protein
MAMEIQTGELTKRNVLMTKKEIIEFLNSLKIGHYYNDYDSWYNCPKTPEGCPDDNAGDECNCGADSHNQKIDNFILKLQNENHTQYVVD